MLKKIYILTILLIVFYPVHSAKSKDASSIYKAEEWLKMCKDVKDNRITNCSNECLACISFVTGTLQGFQVAETLYDIGENNASKRVCKPEGVSTYQSIKLFVKWMEDHPERLHFPAAAELIVSHVSAYPCEEKNVR